MRKYLLFLPLLVLLEVNAQNEFAATAFYADFNKICADAQTGFPLYKGTRKKNEPGSPANDYETKLMLPLADSGKIVMPVSADPYAEFFFQGGKKKSSVDQRAVNLREAIVKAYEKPLFTRTETLTIKKYISSVTYFFTDVAHSSAEQAAFTSRVYFKNGRYLLSFRIRGKSR